MQKVAAESLPQFKLTPEEQKICATLLAANQMFHLGTTFRIAGGWVRDKILGKESDDLDVALDNLTGRQLEQFLLRMGASYGIGKSYAVEANAEKSKHLETVAVEIWGRKIDFVNLRTEEYGESRVPTMSMGTPDVDAARRDLTINSLFYNVNSNQIEDYVGGLQDLKTMTLRTPLNPRKTFMDDPLRCARLLRFYARYPESKIDPAAIQAMSLPEVQQAYMQKVSSERSGPEIIKLLSGEKPAEALRLMFDTGLDKAVFNVPETQNLNDLRMDQRNNHHKHNLLDHTLLVVKNMHDILKQENAPKDLQVKLLLAAIFHDYGKAHPEIAQPKKSDPTQMSYIGHEDKSAEIAESIMRSIGIPDNDRKFVGKVISLHMRPHLHQNETWTPKMMGRFMRESEITGHPESAEIWKYVMLHSMADSLSKDSANPDYADVAQKRRDMQSMDEFRNRQGPSINKPVLNGMEIMALFPNIKPNTGYIKEINEKLLDAQAAGNVSDKPSAEKFIQSMRAYIEEKYIGGNPTIKAWVKANCKFAN
jgi:tRNA nucleotidyltransferase/poly(A) polymerase